MSVNSFFKHINHIPEVPILSNYKFESIVDLPENIHVHDFKTKNNFQNIKDLFSIGIIC